MNNDYIQGQEDLIDHIKQECKKLLSDNNTENIMFNVICLLKELKPLDKLNNKNACNVNNQKRKS